MISMSKLNIVMCPPTYMSSDIKNNAWMEEYPGDEAGVNVDVAMKQFWDLYTAISQVAFVWLLPPKKGLQDQVYVANAAAVLPHLDKTAVLATFKAEGRPGEEDIMDDLLKNLDYTTHRCPYYFEGEAELKWIRDNIYIGGYGIRTSKAALQWMEKKFDMQIIPVKETDKYLYHLDCSIFPLDMETVLVADTVEVEALNAIGRVATVIPVDKRNAYDSMCNMLRIGGVIFASGAIMQDGSDSWSKPMNSELIEICRKRGIQPVFINMEEFAKSGAALSCCCMHLDYDRVRFEYP